MGACIDIEVLVVLFYDVVILRPTPCLHWLISEASSYSLLLLCCSHYAMPEFCFGCLWVLCKCGSKTDVGLMPPLCHDVILLNPYLLTRMAELSPVTGPLHGMARLT